MRAENLKKAVLCSLTENNGVNFYISLACFFWFLVAASTLLAVEDCRATTSVSGTVISDGKQDGDGSSYEMMVVSKQDGVMLALYNTLAFPVDKDSLQNLARSCYGKVGGKNYKKVLINWYLPEQLKGGKPWAVSNFANDMSVIEILDSSQVKKFQSAKRWQQQGHAPLTK